MLSNLLKTIIILAISACSTQLFAADSKVRMAVTAAVVTKSGLSVYEDMAKYISKKLDWDVEVISGLSYNETDQLLFKGKVHVGNVCGLPYTHSNGQYELVAMPALALKKGQFPDANGYEDVPGKYYSYTIVRKDSPYKTWEDLKGKTYAFNSLTSNSGYNVPRFKLISLGAKSWEDYFSKVIKSGSHGESIRLVAQGVVDVSSVESVVLDHERVLGNLDALNVRIIEHLPRGGVGIPPMVISKKHKHLKPALQQVMVNMHKDPEGKKILERALIDHYMVPNDDNYNDIRSMEAKAIQVGFKNPVDI